MHRYTTQIYKYTVSGQIWDRLVREVSKIDVQSFGSFVKVNFVDNKVYEVINQVVHFNRLHNYIATIIIYDSPKVPWLFNHLTAILNDNNNY